MSKSKEITSRIKQARRSDGSVVMPRPNATIEELDQWIISLGGREISKEEARIWNKKIRWANIPGELQPA